MRKKKSTGLESGLGISIEMIGYVKGGVDVLLLLRLIFKAFGANTTSGIVQFVYGVSDVLLIPFKGIFPVSRVGEYVIEADVLVALLIYTIAVWGIIEFINITSRERWSDEI